MVCVSNWSSTEAYVAAAVPVEIGYMSPTREVDLGAGLEEAFAGAEKDFQRWCGWQLRGRLSRFGSRRKNRIATQQQVRDAVAVEISRANGVTGLELARLEEGAVSAASEEKHGSNTGCTAERVTEQVRFAVGVSSPVVRGDRIFLTYQLGASALRGGNNPSFIQGGDAGKPLTSKVLGTPSSLKIGGYEQDERPVLRNKSIHVTQPSSPRHIRVVTLRLQDMP